MQAARGIVYVAGSMPGAEETVEPTRLRERDGTGGKSRPVPEHGRVLGFTPFLLLQKYSRADLAYFTVLVRLTIARVSKTSNMYIYSFMLLYSLRFVK